MKKMHALLFTLLLMVSLCAVDILRVDAVGLIFIRADGSIEGTNKIHRSANTYIFAGDIEESYGIIVEKSDIIIDGKGHTLNSVPRILPVGSWDFGIELSNVTDGNVTIKNLRIVGFNIGVYLWTANNTITHNTIKGSNTGIFLAESPNTIVANYIENSTQGVFLGPLPHDHSIVYNLFYHNSFVGNTWNVYDCECDDPKWKQHLNIWDNGTCGNYWSDYHGSDVDENGIGDAVYSVTEDDVDIYPLMTPLTLSINENEGFLGTSIPFELGVALTAGSSIIVAAMLYVVLKRKKAKKL
ncbi:MAG: hypothetical protein CW691_06015 [Candidatus Bathyarchaeum sp.]|nr:MAG: hypothetical protein CW691_06015 [Candidatus Bathyarchaeum sp.]